MEPTNDLKANLEALSIISNIEPGSKICAQVSELLLSTLKNELVFFKVRCRALKGFLAMGRKDKSIAMKNIQTVISYYKSKFFKGDVMLLQNDFGNFGLYFLRKCIHKELSKMKNSQGYSYLESVMFLLRILEFNDNSQNKVTLISFIFIC